VERFNIEYIFVGGMGLCLLSYIVGHFTGKPFPEMLEIMKWFGIAVGLPSAGAVLSRKN